VGGGVLTCFGVDYSAWKWPDIAGLHSFKGKLLHSAKWDHSVVFDDTQTVAIIGNGSSASMFPPLACLVLPRLGSPSHIHADHAASICDT